MFRFLLVISCLSVPVWSFSTGAPLDVCKNKLTPLHPDPPQNSAVPYKLEATSTNPGQYTITIGGDDGFLGFALQAQDAQGKPIGQFKIVESNKSQTLKCDHPNDTVTHVKLAKPTRSVKVDWIAPTNYNGKVKFAATVAKNGATYWVGKLYLEIVI